MRMWLIDPTLLCRQHLLGEHVEMHMAAGYLTKGHSLKPWTAQGFMDPQQIESRHHELAAEMARREYSHRSPLVLAATDERGTVHVGANLAELARRCPDCRERQERNTS